MFKRILLAMLLLLTLVDIKAQCSMCTKTAASLDDKSARGLNSGILYLAFLPLAMMSFIGYRWYKQQGQDE